MATSFHRPLKAVAFNAGSNGKQSFELSKQLQDHRTDVTHLKHDRLILHSKLSRLSDGLLSGLEKRTAIAVRKPIPHNHVDLPPLVSTEDTGVCVPTGNSEVLLAAVYKPMN